MNASYGIATLAMVIAGVPMDAQAPTNARLGGALGSSVSAAMVPFGVVLSMQ